MIRKIAISIISGLVGSLVGLVIYSTKIHLPHLWKNKEMGSIYAFLFLGFAAGCLLSYIWLNDRENKK
ncbi:MAG: hypothetical protein AMJ78_07980 [Omnitrophica WOR_2 bacterium SM23_29]|nr:MAG: hypothetical protein AMJ78_07980 [Omnitrophica WOR_2 bacterium SM23_29]